MKKGVKWWVPKLGKHEERYLKRVFDAHFPNDGPLTKEFEDKIAKRLRCKHAVAVPNATSGMFMSLKALGIGHGDEVIVPDITFVATANAVEMTGAKPVLVDVSRKDFNISPASVKKAVTKNTKAIIPVHVTGRIASMPEILQIAKKNDLHVVEDAAEALMSKKDGKFAGTFGKTGCFSFSPNKTITTGQGGMIVTDDSKLHTRLIELKDQGRPKRGTGGDDIHDSIGYNFKFTDLQAAVGLGQLHYLDERIARMKKTYQIYQNGLEDCRGISVVETEKDEVPQWTDILADKRKELDAFLLKNGIEYRRYWHPIHRQRPYKMPDSNFNESVFVSGHALWLPSSYSITDEEVRQVIDAILSFSMQ